MTHAPTSLTHWGGFSAGIESGDIASVTPLDGDTDPSPLLGNLPGAIRHPSRIATPAVRRGWLRDGPGPSTRRGADEFVAVSWDELTELLAGELRRVVDTHGNEAIYGGSYGWASAGRFHHAQSQVHRFLKLLGGYTFSRHSYSLGATGVIMPRVVGTHDDLFKRSTAWEVIVEHTDLLVCFGGLALKNTGTNHGGTTGHPARDALRRFRDRGGRIVSFSPLRDDVEGDCEWHAPVPGTDVAIMLALAYVLATESLADRDFLNTYCTGYDRFERYLLGLDDGIAKSPQWASEICGLPADDLIALARRMAARRTIVTVSWSLQRIRHGEQAPWMGLTLAAMLGQIGLPGGGFGHGYGSMNEPGLPPLRFGLPTLPQGPNPVHTFIPVAAISDMLLHPGEPFDYNGRRLTYPDIKLVYWAGGNPFHHHQNIPRLRRALGRVDTIVVHDPYWTAMAKHADIVVPSTTAFERDDYSGSRNDPLLMAMPKLAEPYAQSRDDYTTFAALADALGFGEQFTEGRTARQWLAHMYDKWAAGLGFRGADVRRLLGDGQAAAAHRERADAAGRLPRRPEDAPPEHAERTHRDLLGRHRRVRLRRLRRSPDVVRAVRMARRVAGGSATRCTCWPTSRRRGCTASWISVQSARVRKCKGANPSGCIRSTPRLAGSSTATWCGYSTTAAPAWPAWWSTTACAAMWCNCRPVRGSTRPTPPTRTRCVCTATRTCSPTMQARRHWRGAAPARMCWCRWRSSPGRCHRCGRIEPPVIVDR